MGRIMVSFLSAWGVSFEEMAWPMDGVAQGAVGWFGALGIVRTQPGLRFYGTRSSLPFGFPYLWANNHPSIHPLFLPLTLIKVLVRADSGPGTGNIRQESEKAES